MVKVVKKTEEVKDAYYWVSKAKEAIAEATKVADKTGVGFHFELDGIGGSYTPEPKSMTKEEALAFIKAQPDEFFRFGKTRRISIAMIEDYFENGNNDFIYLENGNWVESTSGSGGWETSY